MSKATTKALIDADITTNGAQAITGAKLNTILNAMVDDGATQEDLDAVSDKGVQTSLALAPVIGGNLNDDLEYTNTNVDVSTGAESYNAARLLTGYLKISGTLVIDKTNATNATNIEVKYLKYSGTTSSSFVGQSGGWNRDTIKEFTLDDGYYYRLFFDPKTSTGYTLTKEFLEGIEITLKNDTSVSEVRKTLEDWVFGEQIARLPLTVSISGQFVRKDSGALGTNTDGRITAPFQVHKGDFLKVCSWSLESMAILSYTDSTASYYEPALYYNSGSGHISFFYVEKDGYLAFCYKNDSSWTSYIEKTSWKNVLALIEAEQPRLFTKLQVAQFNEGTYNEGAGGVVGLPDDANYDSNVQLWRNVVSSLEADIYFACEHPVNSKQGSTAAEYKSYTKIYANIYPYSYGYTNSVHIFSKFPLTETAINYTTAGDRRYAEAMTEINGKPVRLACIHPVAGNTDAKKQQRIADNTEIAQRYANEEYVIIGADTNAFSVDELAPFSDAGFTFANMGYFGSKPTSDGGNPIDNIIVKGFNIDTFIVGEECATSDHHPVTSKITAVF